MRFMHSAVAAMILSAARAHPVSVTWPPVDLAARPEISCATGDHAKANSNTKSRRHPAISMAELWRNWEANFRTHLISMRVTCQAERL